MNVKNVSFKLRWWFKEHMYFSRNLLSNEVTMEYNMPLGYTDFAVHPCVRYVNIGSGVDGWWMVLTPYAGYNNKIENILLYHGVDGDETTPSTKWIFVKEVCGTHEQGYNFDPCLFFDGKNLEVYWRECFTENVTKASNGRCIMCSKTTDGVIFSSPQVVATNLYNEYQSVGDSVMCPIVMSYKGVITMYASIYQFQPYLKPLGVARYVGSTDLFSFDGFQKRTSNGFDLWHFDMFEYNGYLYQIVTGQQGNAIFIGRSDDGKIFKYSKRPLYFYPFFLKKNFFYKATAQVVGGKLFVFFPRLVSDGRLRVVMRSMDVGCLESKFKYE